MIVKPKLIDRHLAYFSFTICSFAVFLHGCAQPSSEKESSDLKARLEVVDSVQMEVMASSLSLMDVHDSTGHLLLVEADPPVVYVFDQKGQLIRRKKFDVDGPEAVGRYILSAEFFEDGIALMGWNLINIYDREFNFRQSLKFPSSAKGMMYMGYNHLQESLIHGSKHLTAFNGVRTDFSPNQPEFYQHFNVMEHVDLKTGNFKPLGKLQPESRYHDGRVHQFLKPTFHTVGNLLHYALDTDTVLYTLDLNSGDVVNKIKIPFSNFVLSQGVIMGEAGTDDQSKPRDWPGKISNLFYINGLHIILYNPGIKMPKIEELKGLYGEGSVREKLDSLNAKKYLIIKNGTRLNIDDIELPHRMFDVVQASPDGYLWASQNVDWLKEEPDYVTFYKLQVVLD